LLLKGAEVFFFFMMIGGQSIRQGFCSVKRIILQTNPPSTSSAGRVDHADGSYIIQQAKWKK
jgi:hypothetical protein